MSLIFLLALTEPTDNGNVKRVSLLQLPDEVDERIGIKLCGVLSRGD